MRLSTASSTRSGIAGLLLALVESFDGDGGLVQEKFVVGEGAFRGDGFLEGDGPMDFFESLAAGEIIALAEEGFGEPFRHLRE